MKSGHLKRVVLTLLLGAVRVGAQSAPFSEGYLAELRRAASFVPGDAPVAVHVGGLPIGRVRVATMVDGAGPDTVNMVYPVYQVRFPSGWISVDAAQPRSFFGPKYNWSEARWDSLQTVLRRARLSVVTHEHYDHTMGILKSDAFAEIRPHAVFTRAQVEGAIAHPYVAGAEVDAATARSLVTIDYDSYMPVAPGVVLVRAAGHTPGSQLVYVRLASGREVLLVGDVSWAMEGIRRELPNSAAYKKGAGLKEPLVEDETALVRIRHWLKQCLDAGVAVVVAHDATAQAQWVAQGFLVDGFVLPK